MNLTDHAASPQPRPRIGLADLIKPEHRATVRARIRPAAPPPPPPRPLDWHYAADRLRALLGEDRPPLRFPFEIGAADRLAAELAGTVDAAEITALFRAITRHHEYLQALVREPCRYGLRDRLPVAGETGVIKPSHREHAARALARRQQRNNTIEGPTL